MFNHLNHSCASAEAGWAGTVRLVGTDERMIIETVSTLLTDEKAYNAMANAVNPYGDGGKATGRILKACQRIVSQYSGNFYGKQTTE